MLGALGVELIIILALIVANGFFAASEISIVSARRGRLEAQAKDGNKRAAQALALAENPDRFLATVQVGISLIGTFAAAFGGARIGDILASWLKTFPTIAPYADSLGLTLVVLGITYASLILGELVPKRLGLRHAEGMAMLAAPIMIGIGVIARPLIAVLSASVSLVLRILRQPSTNAQTVTEDDIVFLLEEGKESGAVEAEEAHLIQQVLRFTDRPVRTVMTPRTKMSAVAAETSLDAVIAQFIVLGYSRLPVYQDSIDKIVGVVHTKDVLPHARTPDAVTLMQIARPPTFVLEHQHVDDVLAMFRREGSHLAIVIDEYGQVAGMLTMEDMLEELVGEIRDEYDTPSEHPFVQRADGSWLVDAIVGYDAAQHHLGLPPTPPNEKGEYTSLAGYILRHLGRVPQVGDTLERGNYRLEIVDMDAQRIDKVLIQRQAVAGDEASAPQS